MSRTFDRIRRYSSRYIDRPLLALPLPAPVQRQIFEVHARLSSTRPRLPVRWQMVGGVRTRVVSPPKAKGRLLWLHGGGFRIGSPRTHAGLTDHLARAAGVEVWSPAYRLSPEFPWPAAPDDCLNVARDMPGPWHLGGDSAGGALALVVLQAMLAQGTPPLSVTLISPVVDVRRDRAVPTDCDEMLLPRAFMERSIAGYLPKQDGRDARQSPILGAYPGAPPVHLELSAREALEGDGHAIAGHLRDAGAQVTVHVQPGVPHVFHLCAGRSSAADAGIGRIAEHLRQAVA